jgi:FKBP-type peptidyl-prolyl cis-trans isomerase
MESTSGGQVATAYAPELGVDLNAMVELEGGLRIRDFEPGAGDTASAGDRVSVNYTGWLPNGVQFDSSDGNPITFTLGVGEVIGGWDMGVAGMQVGGRRMLVIPPAMAYGERGRAGVIPPNATLVFDVTLVDVMPDTTGAAGPGGT